ncbi:MAG: SAM-dependent methyltransferase, partial [Acidobacteria bacterium]|nr:SAM-dependent methyltransferase [Acidobacteriota bacterium]
LHYARTARAWNANLRKERSRVLDVLAATYGPGREQRWRGRWHLFFLACEELFHFAAGDEWFVSHYLLSRR